MRTGISAMEGEMEAMPINQIRRVSGVCHMAREAGWTAAVERVADGQVFVRVVFCKADGTKVPGKWSPLGLPLALVVACEEVEIELVRMRQGNDLSEIFGRNV